jgi:Protein of unknown function (DUF2490)
MKLRTVVGVVCAAASPCTAQQIVNTQKIVNSPMIWAGVFGDHRFAAKSSLYWDLQLRRANAGARWQIILVSTGYTRDLTPQWRATAAVEMTHGFRYGAFAARANTLEFRTWAQVTGTRTLNKFTWSDRTKAELRMLKPVGEFAPDGADWQKTVVRLRRQDRVQHALNARGNWYGAGVTEFFFNVAPARSRVAMLEQVRAQALIGKQLTPRNRAETGYGLQLFNRNGGYELNHILLLYFRTTVPLT